MDPRIINKYNYNIILNGPYRRMTKEEYRRYQMYMYISLNKRYRY